MKATYAAFNVEVKDIDAMDVKKWAEIFEGAALWGGADTAKSTFSELDKVFSVMVECGEGDGDMLTAGVALGFVNRALEDVKDNQKVFGASWFSFVDSDGNVIESPL